MDLGWFTLVLLEVVEEGRLFAGKPVDSLLDPAWVRGLPEPPGQTSAATYLSGLILEACLVPGL